MTYNFKSVCLEGLGICIAPNEVSSEEIEQRLAPLYERLGLSEGRLEFMTGISKRRFFCPGTKPSDISVQAAKDLFSRVAFDRSQIGCVIHSAVCRDFVEPATASVVHRQLGLSPHCQVFDLSNACLGWMNAVLVAASLIELGQVPAALVVSGEDGRGLVDSTISRLNRDEAMTRKLFKKELASLTIGSGGVAALLVHENLSQTEHRFTGGEVLASTQNYSLCLGGVNSNESTTAEISMQTDSTAMMEEGIALAARTWAKFRQNSETNASHWQRLYTHQVGAKHSQELFRRLELDPTRAYSTFSQFGNMGSASVGFTMARDLEENGIETGSKLLWMGIGSGLVCSLLGVQW